MTHQHHRRRAAGIVIAGGGLAGQRAVETLRRNGYDGTIQMLSDERVAPYDRPPLSKDFLTGELDASALSYRPHDWYRDHDVELLLGERAVALDVIARELTLGSGESLPFWKLLIATGSSPRRLPGSDAYANVHHLRNLTDAKGLRDALRPGAHLVVIGAGFIGQEVAATAHRLGLRVTIVEAAAVPLGGVFGAQLGAWFAQLHRNEGIDVHLSAPVARLHGGDAVVALELEDGRRIDCDLVVVGIGTAPATRWLAASGLDDHGIGVDVAGRTRIPGIYAAGDAAKHFDLRQGTHVRTEHWEAAARQGAASARAMLNLDVPPPATPSFWSDQHGIRIQCVGRTLGADEIHIDGDPEARDFTATFADNGRLIGALLVGRPHALPKVRRQIEQTKPHPDKKKAA